MSRVLRSITLALLLSALPVWAAQAQQGEATGIAAQPLFIENAGQFDPSARFLAQTGSDTLWLTADGLWLTRTQPAAEAESPRQGVHLRLSFPGANPSPRLEPFGRLSTRFSYFLGNDPARWRPDVPVWSGVRYVDLYPGVDLLVTGEAGRWTWRLAAREGRLPEVRLRVEGAQGLQAGRGAIRAATAVGEVALPLLGVTDTAGQPLALPGRPPAVLGDTVAAPLAAGSARGVTVQKADTAAIPGLVYSTLLGGSDIDDARAVAVGPDGSAYVAGRTLSADFPTTPGAFAETPPFVDTAFVARLSPGGSALDYATFLGGGSNGLWITGLAVDVAGCAYVCGHTPAADFPTTPGAFQPTHHGAGPFGPSWEDGFVTKLSAGGDRLLYSTYLGGADSDQPTGIAVNDEACAYVTGATGSTDFPTTPGALDNSFNGNGDAFVVKLNAAGSDLEYGTYLGGSEMDPANAIAVDAAGCAYVTGMTASADFPATPGAYDTMHHPGGYPAGDVFVSKLDAAGSSLIYSTFLGGSDNDLGTGIAVDGSGAAYIAGYSRSPDLNSTPGAMQPVTTDFVAKLGAGGDALAYLTGVPFARAMAVDASGCAYLIGAVDSPATPDLDYQVAVLKLDAAGSAAAYQAILAGSGYDSGSAIAVHGLGQVYVAGYTSSDDFPTTPGAYDVTANGEGDAFVAQMRTASPAYTVHLPQAHGR